MIRGTPKLPLRLVTAQSLPRVPRLKLSLRQLGTAGGRRLTRAIAVGLTIAALTGIGAWAFGRPFLTSASGHPVVPVLGELALASAALFDLGVYVTVVCATMLMLGTLGDASRSGGGRASVRRRVDRSGAGDAPDAAVRGGGA